MKAFLLNIKDRLFGHWITSVIGLGVFILGTVLYITGCINETVYCYYLPVVLPWFFSKDSWLISLFTSDKGNGKAVILIGLLGLMGLMSSCYTQEKCNRLFPPTITVHDSIHTEYCETLRDTTIQIPADSAWLRAWLKCDSAGNVIIDQSWSGTGNAIPSELQFSIKNNVLYVKFMKENYELRLQLKDKLIKYYRDKQTTIEHTTNILKPWQKGLLWTAAGILLLSILAIILIVNKFFKHAKAD